MTKTTRVAAHKRNITREATWQARDSKCGGNRRVGATIGLIYRSTVVIQVPPPKIRKERCFLLSNIGHENHITYEIKRA